MPVYFNDSKVQQIRVGMTPEISNDVPLAPLDNGSAGTSEKYARGDHRHPRELPTGGQAGQFLSKTKDGEQWANVPPPDISGKLDKTGNGSDVTVTFTPASSHSNIATGEKLSTLLSKIAKWFADLGTLAFKSTVSKSDLSADVQASLGKADSALQSYTETDPTVPAWAKAKTKPAYSKSEVGLGNVDNVKQYSASNPPPYPVTSVNGKTGAVTVSVPAVPSTAAILKGNGSGSMVAAVAGTDYAAASHTHTQADVTGLEDWDKAVLLKSSSVKTTLPTNTKWNSVCYGNGKFVAITSTSIAAYSTDGINWTQTTLPAYASWYSVCYGGGKFVAVASRKNIAAYSTDGINWVQTTIPILNCQSVCYGDDKFVVVAQSSDAAAYSTDGINWTQTTIGTRFAWTSVCYGDGKFVAIAQDNSGAAYSTDGINWTQTAMPVDQSWRSVCYGNGKFVAVAYGFTNIIAYSTDGINWTQSTMGGSVAAWISVCYGNGKFVVVAQNGANFAYSTDGINWAQTAMPVMANWYANCYGGGKFVAIVYSSNIAACSFIAATNPAGTNVTDDLKTALGAATMPEVNTAIQSAIQNTWEASY